MSVVSATFQPLPTPPTTFSSGIRASSMKSSLNSASPVICRSGRTWTSACSMSIRKYVRPLCLARVRVGAGDEHAPLGVLGARRPDLLAGDDPVVAVADGAGLERGEVRAGLRLGEALTPDLLAGEDRLQEPLLLLVGPPRHERRAGQQEAERVGRQRRAGRARSSSKKIADSVTPASRPPYSRGQCTAAQPPSCSRRLPVAPPAIARGVVARARVPGRSPRATRAARRGTRSLAR